nr:S8 family serine peptidase [Pseudomonadota bacterium]
PPPTPTPTPMPTPPPSSAFDTPEYQASNSAVTAGALGAYNAGATGVGVKVAVIDTGINPNLPEFAGRIDPASADIAASRGIIDHDGHGTMVSGIIAANRDGVYMHGVAFNATILSLNVGDPAGCKPGQDCFLDAALPVAIDHARTNGARIINMSFGDEEGMTPDIWPAIQRAIDAGIIIVMAAGNSPTPAPNGFAIQNIQNNGGSGLFIIAGAMDANRNIASFSSRSGTDSPAQSYLTALGVGNATVDELGNQVKVNGTSFSAPTIAGAAALLAGAFPNLTGSQIVNLLLSTADDAGATGTDAVFGRGILNITRAFQPQGTTTLAGSQTAISLSNNGYVSGPMGDAFSAGMGAVILDGFSRAYTLDLAKTLSRLPQERPLGQAIGGGTVRTSEAMAGPVSVALTIRRNSSGNHDLVTGQMRLNEEQGRQAKAVAGLVISRLTPRTAVAFGLSQSGRTLQRQLARQSDNAFLVARDPLARAGFHPSTDISFGVCHDLGPIAVSVTGERGKGFAPGLDRRLNPPAYTLNAVTLDRKVGRANFTLSASRLDEKETVLGSRFSSIFSSAGSRTTFIDAAAHLDFAGGWGAYATYRMGWTAMSGTGALVEQGRIATRAFAFDLSKTDMLTAGDKFAVRVMQPLRVSNGGFDLNVPAGYDHASGTARHEYRFMSLAPTGREMDYEVAYGVGLWGGYLDVNAFVRTEPGHIEAMNKDVGAAIRFSVR